MSLFKKDKKVLPPLMTEADFDEVGNYDSTLKYLLGLSDDDYKKVIQVADIHRKANLDAAAVLGVANEPTTFIDQKSGKSEALENEPDFLDEISNTKIDVKDGEDQNDAISG